jgi:hypothetical protein
MLLLYVQSGNAGFRQDLIATSNSYRYMHASNAILMHLIWFLQHELILYCSSQIMHSEAIQTDFISCARKR